MLDMYRSIEWFIRINNTDIREFGLRISSWQFVLDDVLLRSSASVGSQEKPVDRSWFGAPRSVDVAQASAALGLFRDGSERHMD
jgi:hypothetical protein